MNIAVGTALRHIIMYLLAFLPKERQVSIERWLRGREDARKLGLADCVIVSFGKSGRTWLRVMLSRFYQVRYGLSQRHLLAFDNLHAKNRAIPKIFFTHDNYLKDYTKDPHTKAPYYDKKVVLMVRDPADVAVSQYHQWRHRMAERKKLINNYPLNGAEIGLYDFVVKPEVGLTKVIDFMNGWASELPRFRNVLVIRYEDLKADTEGTLRRILEFIGTPGTADEVREAVQFASIENMRAMETRRVFWLSGRRMLAGDRKNPESFKVRRAKVGGYRDDFTDDQLRVIDAEVARSLSPMFGYVPPAARPAAESATQPAAQG